MLTNRVAWLAVAGVLATGISLGGGCSGADENNAATNGATCGNGIIEAGEACDDGNTADTDDCTTACQNAACGDGIVNGDDECDDGNDDDDDDCSNDCESNGNTNCGNGTLDDGEECDDGNQNANDACTNACTNAECGDGVVWEGMEDCDDKGEFGGCPDNCLIGGEGGFNTGGDDCTGQAIYAGMVTDSADPTNASGPGIGAVWSFAGQLGVTAGNEMCEQIGADHVCTYEEIIQADSNGELANIAPGTQFWLHRTKATVPQIGGGGMTPPGPGGRCNDWTYPTNHISDGEYGIFDDGTTYPNAAMVGGIHFFFDDDTVYTGNAADGHQCNPPTPGCAGSCGGETPKAILCCFPVCQR